MATLSDPPLVGVHREIDGDALGNGAWENLPDGRQVWRLSIHSLDSIGLRMFFSEFAAGNGRVWIYGGNSSDADGPYSGAGIFDNGQFWSATINGDSAIIEYEPEAGAPRDGLPPFQVKKISHQVRPIEGGALDAAVAAQLSPAAVLAGLSGGRGPLDAITPPDPAAGCNLDVNCYPEWADSAKMVAQDRA